jgi:hypothetical protein
VAAVIGGAGFGTFIDEVGKFVTQDNDYFFQPALAIIYVIFILTYILIRWIHSRGPRSGLEYLVNAMQETQQIAIGDLNRDERDRALVYLDKCDPANPLVAGLKQLITASEVVPTSAPDAFTRLKVATLRLYQELVSKKWFTRFIVLFFVGQLVVLIVHVLSVMVFHTSWLQVLSRRPLESLGNGAVETTASEMSMAAFSLLATLFVAVGAWQIRRSRLKAYQYFQKSILVALLLIQPIMFYSDQWSALIGLTFDIAVFIALRFMIEREQLLNP